MFEARKTVSRIQAVVKRENRELNDHIRQLSDEYLQLCRQTNERLRYCGEFLARGLRGEAIRLAETAPAILDQLAMLDFPELPAWRELCDDYGLMYEPLLTEITDQLNRAYEGFSSFEAMLRHYRKLNLGDAPLNHRLAFLRRLATADPSADHWFADIAEFERARLKEIVAECAGFRKRASLEGLLCLAEEVRMPSWSAPVPGSLMSELDKAIEDVSRRLPEKGRVRRHRLARITLALEKAMAEGRGQEAGELAARWTEAAAASTLPPDAPTRQKGKALLKQIKAPGAGSATDIG